MMIRPSNRDKLNSPAELQAALGRPRYVEPVNRGIMCWFPDEMAAPSDPKTNWQWITDGVANGWPMVIQHEAVERGLILQSDIDEALFCERDDETGHWVAWPAYLLAARHASPAAIGSALALDLRGQQ